MPVISNELREALIAENVSGIRIEPFPEFVV